MIQEFLPIVEKGDKRIILIDGEPVGCLNRVPEEGEFRSNLGIGGIPKLTELTNRDIEICKRIRKNFKNIISILLALMYRRLSHRDKCYMPDRC